MNTILFLLLLSLLVFIWQDSLHAREHAISQCRKSCREMDVQLLDETVALVSFRLRRVRTGQVRPLRHYRFEFSIDGHGRSTGYILLHGYRTETIHLELPDGTIILPQKTNGSIH